MQNVTVALTSESGTLAAMGRALGCAGVNIEGRWSGRELARRVAEEWSRGNAA